MTTTPSTRLWPSRANRNWNWASSARSRWNQVALSVRGSSMAPTEPITGSSNQGTLKTSASWPITQSASILITMSALVTASARFSAIDCPPLGSVSTRPVACPNRPMPSRPIAAVSSTDPSSDTTTCTGPPYRPAATSIEASSRARLPASL